MEKEKLEIVLVEVLEELKSLQANVQKQNDDLWLLQESIKGFDKQLTANEKPTASVDILTIKEAVEDRITTLKELVVAKSQPIVYEKRFLFFPEHYAREYYRVMFRVIMWLTVATAVVFTYSLGNQALKDYREIELIRLEIDAYKKAWQSLYQTENKTGKKKMDNTMMNIMYPQKRKNQEQ